MNRNIFGILVFLFTNISFGVPKKKFINRCKDTKKLAEIKIREEIKSRNLRSVEDLADRNP